MKNQEAKKFIFVLLGCVTLTSCGSQNMTSSLGAPPKQKDIAPIATLKLENPSAFARLAEPTYLSYYDLGLAPSLSQASVSVFAGSDTIELQNVDWDFDGHNDGILFLSDLGPSDKQTYQVMPLKKTSKLMTKKLTQAEISQKSGGQWVAHTKKPNTHYQEYVGGQFNNVPKITPPPQYSDHSNWIRYEGPGIESDKVGYRIYLDWRNGFDIFGKLVSEPVLQNVGLDGYESYHHKEKWGLDILKVGNSLGAGGFGLWHNNQLSLINKTDNLSAEILENGNLRSAFKIDYKGWQSDIGQQDFSAAFSMLGGSRLAKVNLNFTKPVETMAVGVVKHPDTTFIKGDLDITGKAYSYIASWGKQSLDGENLGMAVFFRKEDVEKITSDEHNYIAVLKPKGKPSVQNANAQELEYYFAAVWQPESGIATVEKFKQYLEQEAEKLTIPARQRLKTKLTSSKINSSVTAEQALGWSENLADSELERKTLGYRFDGWDVNRQRKPKFEYDIVGLNPLAYDELAKLAPKQEYQDVLTEVTGSFINEDGSINEYELENFNIDAVAPGRSVLRLFKRTGEEKYRKAAQLLRKQLALQPKTTEGAFWHKKKYTNQLWLDGVYMGMPFLAEYSALFEDGESFDEVVNEFKLTRQYLRNQQTGLYYHAWDEKKQQTWANAETGLSANFWGRGVGWLALALVDVLDYIPEENTEQRQVLLDMITELAPTLLAYQDKPTHTWWQVLDKPNALGNYRESSASSMFTYFFAKAVRLGYLPEKYKTVAVDAYQGLLNEFTLVHADGSVSMTNQCYVAGLGFGRNGSYHYYMSEPVVKNDIKGNFVFIMAGLEIAKLLE